MFRLDNSLGFVMNKVANRLKAELGAQFAENGFDITPDQWSILSRLSEHEGISQNALSGMIAKDKTNITRMIDLMERKGLVRRQVGEDQRQKMLYLTPLGSSTYQQLIPFARNVLVKAQHGISDAEVSQLISTLNRVYENLT